jgi:uncharacterized repeat protein (TIGR03803 family)
MANPRQLRRLTFGLSLGAATAALAIAFMLTVVATQSAQAQTFTVLHAFTGGGDGGNPYAGLTVDGGGNLYGTTRYYGLGYGTVYQLKHVGSNWIVNLLYSFAGGSDGAQPQDRVIFDLNGTLYGTTYTGGIPSCHLTGPEIGCGTVFKLRRQPTACKTVLCPWTETVLYRFTTGADAEGPGYGEVIFDHAGNIYGTTVWGGGTGCNSGAGCGAVYELTPSGTGWTETILYRFSGSGGDGWLPSNGVVLDGIGEVYSTTYNGGTDNGGTIFQLTPAGPPWREDILYNFPGGTDGYGPLAGLIFDQSGNLYGATTSGGTGGGGTVFELTPLGNNNWMYTALYSFSGGTKCGPTGSLFIQAGSLYGITNCGGANHLGSVFKLTPSGGGWTYTSLHDFTGGTDGEIPFGNVVFDADGNIYGTASAGGSHGVGVVWEITFP